MLWLLATWGWGQSAPPPSPRTTSTFSEQPLMREDMDMMQRRWQNAEGPNEPQREEWHDREPKQGFKHDADGEPFDAYIEPEQELFFQ